MTPNDRNDRPTSAEVLERLNDEWLPDFVEPLTHVNQVGAFGNRPIHVLSFRGDVPAIAALVEAGADVNAVGDMGCTPLHDAVEGGHIEAVRFLLEHGATTINVENELGYTPLQEAIQKDREDMIALLADPKYSGDS